MDDASWAKLFESLMLVAFGFAWPANIVNTLKRKSAVGKSLAFLLIVIVGYLFGIAAKFFGNNINYVLFFYLLNLAMVAFDLFLYFLYRRRDRLQLGA
jgi:uncharacterized membrane protein